MCPVARCRRGLRRDPSGSALPTLPQSVSRGTRFSRLHWFAFATACQVARPPGRIGPGFPGPPGTFTSRLPAGRSPFPPLDMTTTATGLLCWRDFHPQEWQLASLHRIGPGFPGPPGAFTSRLPTGRSPFPSLDMTTTATGLLCWRDFHPQEWQLASLHRIGPGFPGPPGAFTSRLPAGRSPFPPLDMTTTATGLLCWRDFHPQEWQLERRA